MTRIRSTDLQEGTDINVSSDVLEQGNLELQEDVIYLNRVAKVVKGGRRFSFSALVVVGDKKCHVGVGFGKANQVPDAIRKGVEDAKKNMFRVPLIGRTIPHEVIGVFGAGRVLLKPASEGTGIIAGPAVRSVVTLAGIKDILTKCLGTNTALNVVKATISGLRSLQDPTRVSERRNKSVETLLGKKKAELYFQTKDVLTATLEGGKEEETSEPPSGEAEKPELAKPASKEVAGTEEKAPVEEPAVASQEPKPAPADKEAGADREEKKEE